MPVVLGEFSNILEQNQLPLGSFTSKMEMAWVTKKHNKKSGRRKGKKAPSGSNFPFLEALTIPTYQSPRQDLPNRKNWGEEIKEIMGRRVVPPRHSRRHR